MSPTDIQLGVMNAAEHCVRPQYEGITTEMNDAVPLLTSSGKVGTASLAQGATFRSIFGKHVFANKDLMNSTRLGMMVYDKYIGTRGRGSLIYTLAAITYAAGCVVRKGGSISLGQLMQNVKPEQASADPPNAMGKFESDQILQPDSKGVSDYGVMVTKVCEYVGGLSIPVAAYQFYSRTGTLRDSEKLPMFDYFHGMHTVDMAPLWWRPGESSGLFYGALDNTMVLADLRAL